MASDVRWRQRYENFSRAYQLLRSALERHPDELSLLEKEGVIQRFEYTLELAWKTMKDFLEAGGETIVPATPKQVIKLAFAGGVVRDGQVWIDMLEHRNLLSHTNDEVVFVEAVTAIAMRYLPAIEQLHSFLRSEEA